MSFKESFLSEQANQTIALMRNHQYQGDYQAVATLANSLPSELRSHPRVALEIGRNRLRQGRIGDATVAFAEADLNSATPGEQLILALEQASSQVYQGITIAQALSIAKSALEEFAQQVDEVEWAEAKRVHIRLLTIAKVYRELDADLVKQEQKLLPELADTLENASYIDESLAARFTYAEYLTNLQESLDALEQVAQLAVRNDRLQVAGEAYVRRAEKLMVTGKTTEEINTNLDQASQYYAQKQHKYGLIDIQRVKARLAIERQLARPELMSACLTAYQEIDLPKSVVSVLMDLSQLCVKHGDVRAADNYLKQTIKIAEEIGMTLVISNFLLGQIDILTRNGNYGEAIEIAQAILALDPPRFLAGSYRQLLATVYSFVGDLDNAIEQGKRAYDLFNSVGDHEATSLVVEQLASYLDSSRIDRNWEEAETLMRDWIVRDEQAGNILSALAKREVLVQIFFNRFYYSPNHRWQKSFLLEAEQVIAEFEAKLNLLPNDRQRTKRLAAMWQLRGMIRQGKNEQAGVKEAFHEALAAYELSGMAMEAANCRYLIGCLRLNEANNELIPHFGEAETNLKVALEYYEQAAMRGQAADTCFMLARLYTNAARRINLDIRTQMLDAALDYLTKGEANYDAMRREFSTGSIIESQQSKQTLIQKSGRIYEQALDILINDCPSATQIWQWTQRAKARALADVMGNESVPLARIMTQIKQYPDAYQLVLQEQDLAQRKEKVSPEQRLVLKRGLEQVRLKMRENEHLEEYLELRTGVAISEEDIDTLLAQESPTCVCIDWIIVGQSLWLVVKHPGHPPTIHPLTISLEEVKRFIEQYLSSQTALRSTLRDTPEFLRELDPLIAPLKTCTVEEELLILSPSQLLHAIPLHALEVNGQVLLERNPVVYCPSLGILRYCLARRQPYSAKKSAALFGNPSGDRPESTELVQYLANLYQTIPLIEEEVTQQTFIQTLRDKNIVHFQGHAKHHSNDALASHLKLADKELTVRDIFAISNLNAEQIILAACESAVNVLKTGDEPLGLIPAFLITGANSVLATLWRVHRSSTAYVMKAYHDSLINSHWKLNKAEALRQAVLKLRSLPEYSTPYHWAPFIINGDWY
ncbi:unknown [Crocosphaera subtropica ATCC 51142]|uniref:CHAT domain-containing protein n=1 Tax=Crocosphaera subtropica (strain ATCC 51142 / BH68) TaxID=43989 RepID=B1X2J7_CROS5|nr:CHAT domain-containing protein [Crocosphaera subtropica]ACB54358.1 unknown [Crocosphaera subtropica ATCC 51142]